MSVPRNLSNQDPTRRTAMSRTRAVNASTANMILTLPTTKKAAECALAATRARIRFAKRALFAPCHTNMTQSRERIS